MSAFYHSAVLEFLQADPSKVLGELNLQARNSVSTIRVSTTLSWERAISLLKATLARLLRMSPQVGNWGLLLEYEIPRRNRRIDAVLLAGGLVFVLEFKTGESGDLAEARRQAEHYALDLRDFHQASGGLPILPVAVARGFGRFIPTVAAQTSGPVGSTMLCDNESLDVAISHAVEQIPAANQNAQIDLHCWNSSAYQPVPSIVEAAQLLFAGQNLRELSHAHSGTFNLTKTTEVLVAAVERAQREDCRIICFVTGVPGAGKTLAGLNAVHSPDLTRGNRPAGAFLSGNVPLVKVITEALALDHKNRTDGSLDESRRRIRTFIQSVQSFLKEYQSPGRLPPERIIVFDEAQRAWDVAKMRKESLQRATTADRQNLAEARSQPAMMLDIMSRLPGWAVVIALVGGGQEIHDGEAGLAEWGRVLRDQYPSWQIFASPEALGGGASVAGSKLFQDGFQGNLEVSQENHLHLPVSIRSYRAEAVAEWVNAVVNGQSNEAASISGQCANFPIMLTRSLGSARAWLRNATRGRRRCGLLASSGALRLRAHGLEVSSAFRGGISLEDWFLAPPNDIRSSNMLEVAMTEFECQGLELDWVGLCWGGDFAMSGGSWSFQKLVGTAWRQVRKPATQEFIRNKYRVLLTRAREGMVIWVPEGDANDATRAPSRFEETASYLQACGATTLSQ